MRVPVEAWWVAVSDDMLASSFAGYLPVDDGTALPETRFLNSSLAVVSPAPGGMGANSTTRSLLVKWRLGLPVIQYGARRTASTFQWKLLCLLVSMKSPEHKVQCTYVNHIAHIKPHQVLKTHNPPMHSLNTSEYIIFTSSRGGEQIWPQNSVYQQELENLRQCPLGEVEKYRSIFDLSDSEVDQLKNYLKYWDILRLCCDLQQSIENRLRLFGCPTRARIDSLSYPECETHNLTAVEVMLARQPLSRLVGTRQPGTCASMERIMQSLNVTDCSQVDVPIQLWGKTMSGLRP